MIGNVREWTDDWFTLAKVERERGGSIDTRAPVRIPRRVLKGGPNMCAESYCPAARYAQPVDTTTFHVSLRCVVRA